MSWFSNRFARSSEPHEINSDGDEEDDHERGQGVKEDLSQLTQTFKRQIWGVASFLAPPPHTKYVVNRDVDDDYADGGAHGKAPRVVQDDDQGTKGDGHGAKSDLSEELVDVDFEALLDETLEDKSVEASKGKTHSTEHTQSSVLGLFPHSSAHNAEHGLTGISRDLAELKGTVATGFSNLLRAVREEIDHVETSRLHAEYDSEDVDDDNSGKSTKFVRAQNLQGIDMYLGPLIKNVINSDKGKILEENTHSSSNDGDDEGDKAVAIKYYDNALPSNLQDAFVHGFRGISEFASSFLSVSLSPDSEDVAHKGTNLQAVGITEEVLAFARNISMHPETWLDFRLLSGDEIDESEISTAQKEHIRALEVVLPAISSLKTELCPDCMTEWRFWNIYFILLHSRLSKSDALLLSTPKIMQARVHLAQRLQEDNEHEALKLKDNQPVSGYGKNEDVKSNQGRPQISGSFMDPSEEVQNKNVLASTVKLATSRAERDADQWLHEEDLAHVPGAALVTKDEDDVSFSDLEEDDGQITKDLRRSSSTQSFDWVQLNKTSSVENFSGLKLHGTKFGDGGTQQYLPQSSSQARRKQGQSESSDWSTVEEDDAASSD